MAMSLGRRHPVGHFKNAQFSQAARLFDQVGFTSWRAIGGPGEDVGEIRKCAARDLSLANEIYAFYAHEKQRRPSSRDIREPPLEELVIPRTAERWAVGRSKLTAPLIHDKEMASAFRREIYESAKKAPPYTPLAMPKIRGKPGPPPPPKPRTCRQVPAR